MPLSVAQLLENGDLIERAREKGARILVPTGALLGLDAVRAAAEGHAGHVLDSDVAVFAALRAWKNGYR